LTLLPQWAIINTDVAGTAPIINLSGWAYFH